MCYRCQGRRMDSDAYSLLEVNVPSLTPTHIRTGRSGRDHSRVIWGEKRNGTRCVTVSRSSVAMEARGIEPRSEHDSDTATTCVDRALVVSLPRRSVSPGSN